MTARQYEDRIGIQVLILVFFEQNHIDDGRTHFIASAFEAKFLVWTILATNRWASMAAGESFVASLLKKRDPVSIGNDTLCQTISYTEFIRTMLQGSRSHGAPHTSLHAPWCLHSQSHGSTQEAHWFGRRACCQLSWDKRTPLIEG
jgi:hypothetical protein